MSYLKTILEKRITELTDDKFIENFRNKLDLFVKIKDGTLTLMESAMELELIDFVTYKGKKYPVRTLTMAIREDDEDDDENTLKEYVIASEELEAAYGDDWDEEAELLDSNIYYYLENEIFVLKGAEIAEKHLDEEFEFYHDNKIDTCEFCDAVHDEGYCECEKAVEKYG